MFGNQRRRQRADPPNGETSGSFPQVDSSQRTVITNNTSSRGQDQQPRLQQQQPPQRSKSVEPPRVTRINVPSTTRKVSTSVPAEMRAKSPVVGAVAPSSRLPSILASIEDAEEEDNRHPSSNNNSRFQISKSSDSAVWTAFEQPSAESSPVASLLPSSSSEQPRKISPPTLPSLQVQEQEDRRRPESSDPLDLIPPDDVVVPATPANATKHEMPSTPTLLTPEESRRMQALSKRALTDEKLDALFSDEDKLLEFVAKVNDVYENTLQKDAPFMTFVLCGVQSSGKSYLVERFMNAVLNIVDDGTATRCPLDITCIHHPDYEDPICELGGIELTSPGADLTVKEVFDRVTQHNQRLERQNRVSKEPLHLVYRAKHVQNMRFVDTPGIKMNQDSSNDDRLAIQNILINEMRKPNAKLCILLQATEEFATQPIVSFCDETFGARGRWIGRAIFLMTKCDLLVVHKRSASDANKFFSKFHENHCFPHLIITPTLANRDLAPLALYSARRELLKGSDETEEANFQKWFNEHDRINAESGSTVVLNDETRLRVGFPSAKKVMRNIMLQDTRKRLPEVLLELRGQIDNLQRKWDSLDQRRKLRNPENLKPLAMQALRQIEDRVAKYIDGNLNACRNFPERMQSLADEIQDESYSEWSSRKLNHYKETRWRDRVEELQGDYPTFVQPDKTFLGGKQIQRAIEFFRAVMVDSLPDPQGEFKDLVANSVGYLGNRVARENWEQSLVQIVETCVKEMSHPGINYVVKHVGYIMRRLFRLALDDIKQDDKFCDSFKVLPSAVDRHFITKFDDMLWALMETAAERISSALEPMYSTIDPSIASFPSMSAHYQQEPRTSDRSVGEQMSHQSGVRERVGNAASLTADGVKNVVKRVAEARAMNKTSFLPESKTAMITDDEADKILLKSFQYIVTLLEFNLVNLRFQMNHHLVIGFKEALRGPFVDEIVLKTNWDELIEPDQALDDQMAEVENQIKEVKASLVEVKGLMED